jgi:hypothetical protein
VSLVAEKAAERVHDALFVIDDQDPRHGRSPSPADRS